MCRRSIALSYPTGGVASLLGCCSGVIGNRLVMQCSGCHYVLVRAHLGRVQQSRIPGIAPGQRASEPSRSSRIAATWIAIRGGPKSERIAVQANYCRARWRSKHRRRRGRRAMSESDGEQSATDDDGAKIAQANRARLWR